MNNATKVSMNNAKTWQLTKSLWKSLLQSGQALFSTLKLRSEGLVPSSGALSRPSELHLWQLHCKTLPSAPGAPVRDLRPFRARAPRDKRK